jgi:hypothetical protein
VAALVIFADMLLHETVPVGRKTPRDGRLEISRPLHEALTAIATDGTVALRLPESVGARGTLDAFGCGCGPDGTPHRHHFVQHPWLATRPVAALLTLTFDGATLAITEG